MTHRSITPEDYEEIFHLRTAIAQYEHSDEHSTMRKPPTLSSIQKEIEDLKDQEKDGQLFLEEEKLVAESLINSWVQEDETAVFKHALDIHPDHLQEEILKEVLNWSDNRIEELSEKKSENKKQKACNSSDFEPEKTEFLKRQGYFIQRIWREMVLNLPVDLPSEPELPEETEFRTVQLGQERQLFNTMEANYQGLLGNVLPTDKDFEEFMEDYGHIREEWIVLWEGDQIIGQVIPCAQGDYGTVDHVGVIKKWRGKKLGQLLTLRAIKALADKGIQEIRLDTDGNNPLGALSIYEKFGFRKVKDNYWFRKDF